MATARWAHERSGRGRQEEDSEFEFVENIETDSDSEADLSPDEEAIADEDLSHNSKRGVPTRDLVGANRLV